MRTIRPELAPSELVTTIALRNTLPEYLAENHINAKQTKFLRDKIDIERSEGLKLVA